MEKSRLIFIDYAKCVGIYLVVLGHAFLPKCLYAFIYSFHMPLFFFISGFLFTSKKYSSYSTFARHRFRQIMVPYFYFNIITYAFWISIGKHFGGSIAQSVPWWKPLIGIFYGNGIDNYLQHCTPLWFLPCIFCVECLYYFLSNYIKPILVIIVFMTIGFMDYFFNFPRMPWGINIACTAIVFYGVANLSKELIYKTTQHALLTLILIVLLFAICTIYLSQTNKICDMNYRIYNNYFLFIFCAFVGIVFIFSLSILFQNLLGNFLFLEYISKNTIVILAFQGIAWTFIKGTLEYVLKLSANIYTNTICINVILSFVNILMLLPLIFVLNRYLPIVLGRNITKKIKK